MTAGRPSHLQKISTNNLEMGTWLTILPTCPVIKRRKSGCCRDPDAFVTRDNQESDDGRYARADYMIVST
jgi:hypothetical protein